MYFNTFLVFFCKENKKTIAYVNIMKYNSWKLQKIDTQIYKYL